MTRAVSEKRRPKGGPLFDGKCLFGADRKPKQIVEPAERSRGYKALSGCIKGMAAEVERMMEEGED